MLKRLLSGTVLAMLMAPVMHAAGSVPPEAVSHIPLDRLAALGNAALSALCSHLDFLCGS